MKRGAWKNRGRKARFTGDLAVHIVGRKTECRNYGCRYFMVKGEECYAAGVDGIGTYLMGPSINDRPEYFGHSPYVLICKECGDRYLDNQGKRYDPRAVLRRK